MGNLLPSLNQSFLDEIKKPSTELLTDLGELYIDDILKNEALKEVPVIKNIIGIVNTGIAINQFFTAKKIAIFIQQINDGTIKDEDYNAFRHKVETDYKYGQKIAEKLLVMIDRQVEITQTKITANLFKAYVAHKLNFEELSDLLILLNNLHPSSYNFFFSLDSSDYSINENITGTERNLDMENLVISSGVGMRSSAWSSGFRLSQNGISLFEYGIKPLANH